MKKLILLFILLVIILLSIAFFFIVKNYKKKPAYLLDQNSSINFENNNVATTSIIKISDNKRYFVYPDGNLFYPIGTSLNGAFITYEASDQEIETYLSNMQESGENFIRFDIEGFSWTDTREDLIRKINSGKITFLENPVGKFNEEHAKKIDNFLELAKKYDIFLEMTLTSHSCTLQTHFDLYPYYKGNGGPVTKLAESRENTIAKELFKNRIKYIIDRWGYNNRIIAWELENEINWEGCGGGDPEITKEWIEEMSTYIKNYEQEKYGFNRPVSFSIGAFVVPSEFTTNDYFFTYTSNKTDIIHHHFYDARASLNPVTSAKYLNENVIKNLENANFTKPFMEDERKNMLRLDFLSKQKILENEHYTIFAYLASGAAGAGLTWTEFIYDTPTPVAKSAESLMTFLKGFNSNNIINSKPIYINSTNEKTIPFTIGNKEFILGWIINDNEIDYDIELISDWKEIKSTVNTTFQARIKYITIENNILQKLGAQIDLDNYFTELKQKIIDYANNNSINLPTSINKDMPIANFFKLISRNIDKLSQEQKVKLNTEVNLTLDSIENELQNSNVNILELYTNHSPVKTTLNFNLNEGEYKIKWFDDTINNWIKEEYISGSNFNIETPLFSRHIAFVIEKI